MSAGLRATSIVMRWERFAHLSRTAKPFYFTFLAAFGRRARLFCRGQVSRA